MAHDFRDLPRLDAVTDIQVYVQEAVAASSRPDDPEGCALACTLRASGYEARVMNEVVLVQRPADRAVISHNRRIKNKNALSVRVGDMIHYRYRLSKPARSQRRKFDHRTGFAAGHYTLRAPSEGFRLHRDKRSATRRQRNDAHAAGEAPRYTRQVRLMRAARVSQELRGSKG